MEEKPKRERKPHFTDTDNLVVADFYREHVGILQSKDGKADSAKRKNQKIAELTNLLNSNNAAVKRTETEVHERIKTMLRDVRKLPHCKKTTQTGGGPPLAEPSKEWMKVLLPIVREHPCTKGIEGGLESGVTPSIVAPVDNNLDDELEDSTPTSDDVSAEGSAAASTPICPPSSSRHHPVEDSARAKRPRTIRPLPLTENAASIEKSHLELLNLEKEKARVGIEAEKAKLAYYQLKFQQEQERAAQDYARNANNWVGVSSNASNYTYRNL